MLETRKRSCLNKVEGKNQLLKVIFGLYTQAIACTYLHSHTDITHTIIIVIIIIIIVSILKGYAGVLWSTVLR